MSSRWKSSVVPWDQAPKATRTLLESAWRNGALSWKLNPNQETVYNAIREWEHGDANNGRMYTLDISRRWGKSFTMILMAFEDALRHKDWRVVYCAPTYRMVQEILMPLITQLLQDCPTHYRPEYFKSTGTYKFTNGSVLKLVGMDVNPDGARGTHIDRGYLDECGFFENLEYVLFSVMYPQMQMRDHARIIAGSTPPISPSHYWSAEVVPAAVINGSYQKRTIEDNPMLTAKDVDEFCNAVPGGRSSVTVRREYFCQHIADTTLSIIPEWIDVEKDCVREEKPPLWRDCYVAMDPGWRDLTAVLFGYWNFDQRFMYIEDEIAESKVNSRTIAALVMNKERELWGGLKRRSGDGLKDQPYRRISDNDSRLIHDLSQDHQLMFVPTQKDNLELQINSLRVAVGKGQIVVHPRCTKLISHLRNGVWKNAQQSKFAQGGDKFGHFDLIAALVYLWRNTDQHRNPYPKGEHYVAGIKQTKTNNYRGLGKPTKWAAPHGRDRVRRSAR